MTHIGFRLVYHSSIPETDNLFKFLESQKAYFCSENSYKCRRDYGAYFRRGLFGFGIAEDFSTTYGKPIVYTFKRLSRGRRIFGIVPVSLLVGRTELKLDQCPCAIHRGGQRVTLSAPYSESDYKTYFEVGKIKGEIHA